MHLRHLRRVNVGCGRTPTPTWLNFDNSWAVRLARVPFMLRLAHPLGLAPGETLAFAEDARRADVRWAQAWRLPLADATTEVVYSSHMLEHLDQVEARSVLREIRRVLSPGGILRLAVPDLRLLVEAYQQDKDADVFVAGTHLTMTRPRTLAGRLRLAVVGPRHHLWMYDGDSLVRLLLREGFHSATVLPAGSTTIRNPAPLNLRERMEESVYVEAAL